MRKIALGFDSYSIRALGWKAPQLLQYAAELKLDTIQFSSLNDLESREPVYLAGVKDQAARRGIAIEAGMGCICRLSAKFAPDGPPAGERLREGLRAASALGSKRLRCYMGNSGDRLQIEACMEETVRILGSVRSEALDLGVKIALENHADLQARELKTIIEWAGPEFVGACLDTGNPVWAIEDPYLALETLAPYVVTTHVRDSVVFETDRGAAFQWVNLGDGCLDVARFVREFLRFCPAAAMQLETISGGAPTPLPYLDGGFWKAFPKMPAWEFARFLGLVKHGAARMMAPVVEPTGEQQRMDLECSLRTARATLAASCGPVSPN